MAEGTVQLCPIVSQVSNLAWAFARLKFHHDPLLLAIERRVLQPKFLFSFKPEELANLCRAFGNLRVEAGELMRAVAQHLLVDDLLVLLNAHELGLVVRAFGALQVHDAELVEAVHSRLNDAEFKGTFTEADWANVEYGLQWLAQEEARDEEESWEPAW